MRSKFRNSRAFTLVEMLVATGLVGVASLGMISIMTSTMKLSSQNMVTNSTNYRARQMLDRLGEIVRYAQDMPVLVTNTGATATGSTSDGILVKNAQAGMYTFKNASGKDTDDIPSGASSFTVVFSPKSLVPGTTPDQAANGQDPVLKGKFVEPPEVGDYFLLGLSTHPELEVAKVYLPVTKLSNTLSSVVIDTKQAITEKASCTTYTVSAARYRKEAYIFAQSGTQYTLRHYPHVVAGLDYTSSKNYFELGSGFQKLVTQTPPALPVTQPFFTTTTVNGTQSMWLQAVARSSGHAEYAESISNHTTLTTMPVQVKLWNYNPPPPPAS